MFQALAFFKPQVKPRGSNSRTRMCRTRGSWQPYRFFPQSECQVAGYFQKHRISIESFSLLWREHPAPRRASELQNPPVLRHTFTGHPPHNPV